MAAKPKQIDAGLQEIADWHQWFVQAHTQRLTDLQLPADQHARDLAVITAQAAAIRERMESDYLLRRS